jgi:protein-S-isoprenylcysteine O-methyltransferase Ste14
MNLGHYYTPGIGPIGFAELRSRGFGTGRTIVIPSCERTGQGRRTMEWLGRAGKLLRTERGQVLVALVVGGTYALYVARNHTDSAPHSFHDVLVHFEQNGFPPGILISILMFVAFSIYWEQVGKKASAAKTSESWSSRGFHLALVSAAQILVLAPVPGLRARFLPDSNALLIGALVLEAAFFLLAVWARQFLGRNWSGAVTTKVDHELIRSGPYSVVRHPIYSGILGVYLSLALVSGEIHGLIGVAIAFIAYWRKSRMEEQYLRGQFGAAYDAYQSETWAVIPGVW